jgi:hypothetical protein
VHKPESAPSLFVNLLGFGYRVGIGAVLGFACAVAIIAVNSSGTAFSPEDAFNHAIDGAWKTGGLLGAIYLPLATYWFLPKQNRVKAVTVAFCAAIIFGIVGDAAVGPWAPASVSASLGFWLIVFAIYQHDQHGRAWHGRGPYLP